MKLHSLYLLISVPLFFSLPNSPPKISTLDIREDATNTTTESIATSASINSVMLDSNSSLDDKSTKSSASKGSTAATSSTGSGTKAASGTTSKAAASSVMAAANAFASDANTVSSSINTLSSTTKAATIKSLASTAFKAESDEDSHRAVLALASGSAGSKSNALIVKNTPAVLTGLMNIMKNPTTTTVKTNLATIQKARNPNILPSITQLSNSAMAAVGLPQTAQKFTATTG